ncbi:hypothetical protein C8R44DRAFT_813935 [Mycena epipterygia]|nr:hypothetical protein C8R44DRAFT_813935 [Mycena epipterygia]
MIPGIYFILYSDPSIFAIFTLIHAFVMLISPRTAECGMIPPLFTFCILYPHPSSFPDPASHPTHTPTPYPTVRTPILLYVYITYCTSFCVYS